MNKQFLELFDKAVMEQCLANGDPVDNPHAILERFAELIVKECLSVQNKCPHDIAAGKFVRNHFGIEK